MDNNFTPLALARFPTSLADGDERVGCVSMNQIARLLVCLIAFRVMGQSLAPPVQGFVLRVVPQGAAFTTSLSIGTSFTMECWVSLEAASPYGVIMGKPNNPRGNDPFMNYVIGLDQVGTSLVFVQTTGQPGAYRQITATTPTPFHTWTHVAAVLDSGIVKLYVNGQLVASGPSPGPPAGTGVPFALGGAIPDGQNLCCSVNAALRQARIWSRALSQSEIEAYASETLTGDESGLIAYWPLDDGSGSARDLGPLHLTLTLAGSAMWGQTALYDAGPYWTYQTFQTSSPGYGTGTVVDMDESGVTSLTASQLGVTVPGPARAFRWEPSGFADVTSTVLPVSDINVLSPRDWAVADYDGDGRLDAFLASHGLDQAPYPGGQSHIFIQSDDGRLVDETASRIPTINNFTHTVAATDIDGDGDIDLYVGNINGGTTGPQLYLNDGSGHFTPQTAGLPDFLASRQQVFTSARFLDVNNDGFPDLILGSDQSSSSNVVLLNDGHGNFTATPGILPAKVGGLGWLTVAISQADYDGDGYTDLIFVMTDNYRGHSALQLLLNNHDGTFRDASSQIPQNWPIVSATNGQLNGSWIQWVVPCDINGDGWVDFITAGGSNLSPRLFINQGQGQFIDATAALPAGAFSTQVQASDFESDGKTDLFFDFGGGSYGFAQNLKPILPIQAAPELSKPVFTAGSITNAASFQAGSVAPGEIITIFGSRLGPVRLTSFYTTDATHITKSISGTRVLFDGIPAPMVYTSATQLTAIVPYSVAGKTTVNVQVEYELVKSDPVQVRVTTAAPGLFMQNTSGAGAILNQDGSLNTPATPAAAGSTIVLFGTGEG